MDLVSAIILAIVQGVLEWFPVSSSGHLVLTERFLGFGDGLDLQVALHFGTLLAVFVYFRKDIVYILRDIFNGNWKTHNARLGFLLFVASIPVGVIGFVFGRFFGDLSSNMLLLGFGWLITSVVLFIGSNTPKKNIKLGYCNALFVGFAQVLALFPGVSRSGSTISSGLFLGMNEKEAIKFSYLLSIPVIIGASVFTFGNKTLSAVYLLPTLVCFVLGLLVMNVSFNYVLSNRKNLKWFGIYTLILAIVVIGIALF